MSVEGPVAELKVDRARVGEVLGAILDRYTLVDMSVQDPPLDQVIARVFEEARADHEEKLPESDDWRQRWADRQRPTPETAVGLPDPTGEGVGLGSHSPAADDPDAPESASLRGRTE